MSGEGFYQLGMAYHHANRPDDVTKIVRRLVGFEPKRAKKLVHDAKRADLMGNSFRNSLSELRLKPASQKLALARRRIGSPRN